MIIIYKLYHIILRYIELYRIISTCPIVMATGDMLPKISEEGGMTTLKILSPRGKLMEPSPSQRMVIEVNSILIRD